jgi:uncharacterized paraquat-inducible protein A
MRKAAWFLSFLLAMSFGGSASLAQASPEQVRLESKQEAFYTCPMHPEVKSKKPGKCPKCGMNLEKSKKNQGKGRG